MKSLLTWTERRLLRVFRKLWNRQNFHLKAEMFSFHSKYFVYRELKRAPQKLSFCFKCPDTGTVRILGNILYPIINRLRPITTKTSSNFIWKSDYNYITWPATPLFYQEIIWFEIRSPLDRESTVFLSLSILNAVSNNLLVGKFTYTLEGEVKLVEKNHDEVSLPLSWWLRKLPFWFCHHFYYLDSLLGLLNMSAVRGLLFNAGLLQVYYSISRQLSKRQGCYN